MLWEEQKFKRFLEQKKMEQRSERNRTFEARRSFNSYFGAGLAECADPAEAFELERTRCILGLYLYIYIYLSLSIYIYMIF